MVTPRARCGIASMWGGRRRFHSCKKWGWIRGCFMDACRKSYVKLQKRTRRFSRSRKGLMKLRACFKILKGRFLRAGQLASEYLKSRGVSSESIENFRIGSGSRQSLRDFLRSENYSDKEIESVNGSQWESNETDAEKLSASSALVPRVQRQAITTGSAIEYCFRFATARDRSWIFRAHIYKAKENSSFGSRKYINTPIPCLQQIVRAWIDKAKSAIREPKLHFGWRQSDAVMSSSPASETPSSLRGTAFSQTIQKF